MADSLLQIQQLIALAAGDGEEARTAAWLACKKIREGGYRVESGLVSETAKRAYETRACWERGAYQPWEPPTPTPTPPPPTHSWKYITTKYGSHCSQCAKQIPLFDWIWWKKGERVRCGGCGPGK